MIMKNSALAGLFVASLLVASSFAWAFGAPEDRFRSDSMLGDAQLRDMALNLAWSNYGHYSTPAPSPRTWAQAKTFCSTNYGSAWRLPTAKELFSLIDSRCDGTKPCIAHDFRNVTGVVWSSTSPPYMPDHVMAVDFAIGDIVAQSKTGLGLPLWVKPFP